MRKLTIVEPSFTPQEYVLEDKIHNQPKFNIYLGDRLWLNFQSLANRCCHVDFYVSVLDYYYSKKMGNFTVFIKVLWLALSI